MAVSAALVPLGRRPRILKCCTPMPPPSVESHQDLSLLREAIADSVVVSIDLEKVDHRVDKGTDQVSELGIAWVDMRDVGAENAVAPFGDPAELILAEHHIFWDWCHITAETCPARWHQAKNKPHAASPYTAMFCSSSLALPEEMPDIIQRLLDNILCRGLSEEDEQAGFSREVVVLYWDATMETAEFRTRGIRLERPHITQWDLQLWNALARGGPGSRQRADFVLPKLGLPEVIGGRRVAHNSSNDAWMNVAGLLRVLHMSGDEWESWCAGGDLDGVSLDFVCPFALSGNLQLKEIAVAGRLEQLRLERARAEKRRALGEESLLGVKAMGGSLGPANRFSTSSTSADPSSPKPSTGAEKALAASPPLPTTAETQSLLPPDLAKDLPETLAETPTLDISGPSEKTPGCGRGRARGLPEAAHPDDVDDENKENIEAPAGVEAMEAVALTVTDASAWGEYDLISFGDD